MKIELRKETDVKDNVRYYVYLNDGYVSDSLCTNLEDAEKMFEKIKSLGGQRKVEVLKSEEI